jgi:NHL repeat
MRFTIALTILALTACAGPQAGKSVFDVPVSLDATLQHATGTQYLFVVNPFNLSSAEVAYFPLGSNGNVPPAGAIVGSNTQLTGYPEGVAVDANGEIYVAELDTNSILGYPPGSNGDVAPNVVIHGSATGLAKPVGLALDAAGDIYVANCSIGPVWGCPFRRSGHPSVVEFAAGSNGDVAPIRAIKGKRTGFVAPFSIAIGANSDIYVLDSGNPPSVQSAIDVFGPNAEGNVRPKRVIAGSTTLLNQAYGLVVTSLGIYTDTWNGKYLERFRLRARGNVAPVAIVEGKRTQLNCCLDGMAAGPDGSVYVTDRNGDQTGQSVQQFGPTAKGDAAPLTEITGSGTGLAIPVFVTVGTQP